MNHSTPPGTPPVATPAAPAQVDGTGVPATPGSVSPGFTLWQYAEKLWENWKDAETQLTKASQWLVLLMSGQVLTLTNPEFQAAGNTEKLQMLGLEVQIPAYAVAVAALPIAVGYWLSQYTHSWVNTKVQLRVHRAATVRLLCPERTGSGEPVDDELAVTLDHVERTLTPAVSVTGRIPGTRGKMLREQVGTPWSGVISLLLIVPLEFLVFWRLDPFDDPRTLNVALWLFGLLLTLGFFVYSALFVREPSKWRDDDLVRRLALLEDQGRLGRI